MSAFQSTHEVAVKTETTKTTERTTTNGSAAPAKTTKTEHRVESEGQPKQVQPDGR